jgi:hypothetical protein
MAQLIKSVSIIYAACSAIMAVGCVANQADDDGSDEPIVQESQGHTEIHTEDRCDPATFNAGGRVLCNPNFNGGTTLAQFNAELTATKTVQAWEYGGGQIRVNSGTSFKVDNKGGETHTFSVVANFGGGRVAGLNTASGNTTVAPECVAGANAANVDIASGAGLTVTTGANGVMKGKGTFKVQCCIHPWMRTTVQLN